MAATASEIQKSCAAANANEAAAATPPPASSHGATRGTIGLSP